MANSFFKHKNFHEKLESHQDGVNNRSFTSPYSQENSKREEALGGHKTTHLTKKQRTLLRCDLLKDLPFNWLNTKKRTIYSKKAIVEEPCEGKKYNGLASSSLPIKKRQMNKMCYEVEDEDGDEDEDEGGKCLAIIEVIKSEENYVCDICGRSFKSHQALGGHKSHHRRSIKLELIDEFAQRASDKIHHKCSYCNKKFPTGQALGGHMRSCKKRRRKSHSSVDDTSEDEIYEDESQDSSL